ncbi:MAG TPA: PQQ-dependent sugar dehydrogenase, partial [Chthonomonadales bacterium]|nr:PQQ-dependent sugar dehydrogenase [Chthonomonadales bacterium]
PVHCCFDDEGNCYVVESGHKIDAVPRILKVDTRAGEWETFFTLPEDRWVRGGSITGACWHKGHLYVMNTDELLRVSPDGQIKEILRDLPGKGDHQSNHPILGPDGKIYFGQGCATNCGVVGADNFAFEWLPVHPEFCDVPAQDIKLAGRNYESQNVLGNILETVQTGAYVPFGTVTYPGQVIKGSVRCSGSILRCNPDGSKLEVVAWGLRNPYGLAFTNDGRLFATEHGMDERGRRYIVDDPDDFYEVKKGEWYGWPDFASGIRLDDPYWGESGHGREPVLAEFPNPNPPRPLASFQTHSAANGFDFCRDAGFGFEGDAFVACFGDLAPITTIKRAVTPAGFKVVRVDMKSGQVHDFAINKMTGPASKLPHEGFERPSHCQFGPDGALYVVDFGTIRIAPERGAIRQQMGTGTLWRIRRTGGPQGLLPPKPVHVPLYLLQGAALVAGVVGLGLASAWLLRKLRSRGNGGDGGH